MKQFVYIFINPSENASYDDIEKRMNQSLDWIKMNSQNWIVYTTSGADKWTARLKPLVEPDGNLFVCKLDITEKNGWMPTWFWEWIREKLKSAT